MFFANYVGGPPFTGVVVEHNVFTHALNGAGTWHDGAAFVIPNGQDGQNQVNNWVVRYNTFEVPPDISSTPSTADDNGSARFYGNLGADGDCGIPEWTYSYNIGETCGGKGEVRVRPESTRQVARTRRRSTSTHRASTSAFAPAQRRSIGVTPPPTRRSTPTASDGRSAASRTRARTSSDPVCWSPAISVRARARGVLRPPRYGGSSRRTRRTSSSRSGTTTRRAVAGSPRRGARASGGCRRRGSTWRAPSGLRIGARGRAATSTQRSGCRRAYYVRRLRDVEVIVLDSTRVTAAQTAWLQRTLAAAEHALPHGRPPPPAVQLRRRRGGGGGCAQGMGSAPRAPRRAARGRRARARLPALPQGAAHLCRRNRRVEPAKRFPPCPRGYPRRLAAKLGPAFVYVTAGAGRAQVRAVGLDGRTIDRFRVG